MRFLLTHQSFFNNSINSLNKYNDTPNMKVAVIIAAWSVAVMAFDGPAPIDHGTRIDKRDREQEFGRRHGANIPGLSFMEQREEEAAKV